ncbi:tetratricopeptide repeat protein [Phototrophicus methaneseepsis]|uniref:Tetratricopeptide repeat protein n=1 Tax=Phototrophicus methaneseepsis TaxID=2710758 RepID=A0A7S8E6M2_9CHLR|nr:tetratricopeptide repeat protein [Phototrophicus methaneseepsis]QPC81348.1 tetratricopeptide repeat protein [Phototrophicus methaneseepsis]
MQPAFGKKEVFIERKEYMSAFRQWIENDQGVALFGDTESIYGTGKTTILKKLYSEYKDKVNWIAVWLELDRYSLYNREHISSQLAEWTSVEAYLQNLYDFRVLLEALAHEFAVQDPKLFGPFESEIKRLLEEVSDNKYIGFFRQLKIDLSGMESNAGDVNIVLEREPTPENVTQASYLNITNSQIHAGGTTYNFGKLADAEDRVKRLVMEVVHDYTAIFAEQFNRLETTCQLTIFGDDYCYLYDQRIGDWFLDLLLKLDRTAHVISRTISGALPESIKNRAHVFKLGNFTRQETKEYLVQRLSTVDVPEVIIDQIYQFSAGNPLMVGLTSNLFEGIDINDSDTVGTIIRGFKKLPPATIEEMQKNDEYLGQRLAQLMDQLHDMRRHDELFIALFDFCSIVRYFDYPMARFALTELGLMDSDDDKKLRQLFANLRQYSFVENVAELNQVPRYRFHMFVRELQAMRLEERDPKLFEQLHGIAEKYYQNRIHESAESQSDLSYYEQLYHFENEEWQFLITEWLYHASMVSSSNAFMQTQIEFATQYFEAFSWWGCYVDFPLCNNLLAQWEWTLEHKRGTTAEHERLGARLRKFHDAFPIPPAGIVKPAGEHWKEVKVALMSIMSLLKLGATDLSEEKLHLRALLLEFLGYCYLYSGDAKDLERAKEIYKEAYDIYIKQDDSWYAAWMLTYLGEVYVQAGAYDDARKVFDEAREEVIDESLKEQDNELISRGYYFIGDAYWQESQYKDAFATYNKCIFFAFTFLWHPNPPDPYTLRWYSDCSTHVIDQLLALYHEKQLVDEALHFGQCLHQFWGPYWAYQEEPDLETLQDALEQQNIAALKVMLFPPQPMTQDMGDPNSDYAVIAEATLEEMYESVETLDWDCASSE